MNKTKRRIFTTAIKLFAEKGFENTGIEEITAVAGVAKGSLYYHFETKEELFDLALEEGAKLLNNSIEIKSRHCKNALEKLKVIVMVQIKSIIRYKDFVTVIINNTLGENSRTIKCRKAVNEYVSKIADVIKEGVDEGIFYDGDIEGIALGIFGTNFTSLLYTLKTEENVTAEQIYKSYIETIIRGITKRRELCEI
ncbi:MAG: TetR/AcrR family transcriptional regulator [Clostridia bacterium]|nr:TetR/AcrR family transcriptional regulator [Clostridia bacterium]